jgi:hypothetical protein
MKRILIFCVLATAIAGCKKDKFKTEPQVEIKSFGPAEVQKGEIFAFRATIRDKEGDLQDSVRLARKIYSGTTLLTTDTLFFSIKDFGFPDQSTIELQALFSYGEIRDGYIFQNLPSQDRNITIGIIVNDKAGHKSTYVESDKILLKKL